ncbi:hypothetical protein DUNSADRAFT_2684 [Dunaliella salina]|uniref:Uncharacterized protein n=1 Tax=Dunaliella salina TaxID=3046 RepID=A0ABQ7H892_DUNSA|nr:hypothetical protein DUNSADRAFT_2684 [Dunaliella salina]|eukprot:KAF5843071.1 hypothetical protein DUNSADRAFT_2684 [Dunaliella salina]
MAYQAGYEQPATAPSGMALEQPADAEPWCTVCGISEKDVMSDTCADCTHVILESLRDAPSSSCNLTDHGPSAAYEVHGDHVDAGIEWGMHECDLTASSHSLREKVAQRCTVCGGDDRVDLVSNICAPCTFILSESRHLAPVHPASCASSANQSGEGQDEANLGLSLAACDFSESSLSEQEQEGNQPEYAKHGQSNPDLNTDAEPVKGGLADLLGDCLGHIASCLDKFKDRQAFSHTCRSMWNAEQVLHQLGSLKVTLTLADHGAILRLAPFWQKQRMQLELIPMKRKFKRVLILESCGDLQQAAGASWFRDDAAPSLEGAVLDSWSKITDNLPECAQCALASFDEVVLQSVHLEKMEEAQALGIDMLRKCPNIVSLTVDCCHIHSSFLNSMSPALQSISISGFSPQPRCTQLLLQAFGALPELKHLSLAPESLSRPKPPLDLSVLVGRCPLLETLTLHNASDQEGDGGSVPLQGLERLLPSCPSLQRLTLGRALTREANIQLRSPTLQYIVIEQSDVMGIPCCDYSCFPALREARIGCLYLSRHVMDGVGVFAAQARAISHWQPSVCIDAIRLLCVGHQIESAYAREMLQVLSALQRQAGHNAYSLFLSGFLHPDTLSQVSSLLPNIEEAHILCCNDDVSVLGDAHHGEVCCEAFLQSLLGFPKLRRLMIGGSTGDELVLWICQQAQASKERFWSLKVVVRDWPIKVKCRMLWQSMVSGQQQRVFIE